CAGAVSEEDAGASVGPVHDAGHGLRADDEGAPGLAGGDELARRAEGSEEAGAGGVHVERGGVQRADAVLDEGGDGGEHAVRGAGAGDDEVDVAGLDACGGEGAPGCLDGEAAGGLGLGGDAAFADAGAFADPLVRGLDEGGEVIVRHDALRHVATNPNDACALRHDRPFRCRPTPPPGAGRRGSPAEGEEPVSSCTSASRSCSSRRVRWWRALIAPSVRPIIRPISAFVLPSTYFRAINCWRSGGRRAMARRTMSMRSFSTRLASGPGMESGTVAAASRPSMGGRRPRSRYQLRRRLWAMLITHDWNFAPRPRN